MGGSLQLDLIKSVRENVICSWCVYIYNFGLFAANLEELIRLHFICMADLCSSFSTF